MKAQTLIAYLDLLYFLEIIRRTDSISRVDLDECSTHSPFSFRILRLISLSPLAEPSIEAFPKPASWDLLDWGSSADEVTCSS